MALNANPLLIRNNTTCVDRNRVYIVVPNENNVTLNLASSPASSGLTYIISNQNSDYSVTISNSSANIRFSNNPLNDVSSFILPGLSVVEITYNDGYWLVGRISYNSAAGVASLLSGTCTSNSSNPWVVCDGGSNYLITRVTINTNSTPSSFIASIYNISAGPALAGQIVLATDTTLATKILAIPVSNVGSGFRLFSTSTILNTIVSGNSYYIGWIPTGGNSSNKIGICSLRLS